MLLGDSVVYCNFIGWCTDPNIHHFHFDNHLNLRMTFHAVQLPIMNQPPLTLFFKKNKMYFVTSINKANSY